MFENKKFDTMRKMKPSIVVGGMTNGRGEKEEKKEGIKKEERKMRKK